MSAELKRLTREQYAAGLDKLVEWFPHNKDQIQQHRDVILRHLQEGTKPVVDPSSPSSKLQFVRSPKASQTLSAASTTDAGSRPSRECRDAMASLLADICILIMELAGAEMISAFKYLIKQAIIDSLGSQGFKDLMDDIQAFVRAADAHDLNGMAKAIFSITVKLFGRGVFKAILDIMADKWSFWEWLYFSSLVLANIGLWVVSDGVVLIIELIKSINDTYVLFEDAKNVAEKCNCQ